MVIYLAGLCSRRLRRRYFERTGRWWWGFWRFLAEVFLASRS